MVLPDRDRAITNSFNNIRFASSYKLKVAVFQFSNFDFPARFTVYNNQQGKQKKNRA